MRTVPQSVIDAVTSERIVGGRIQVTDNRMSFDEILHYESDTQVCDGALGYDADIANQSLIRAVNKNNVLWVQAVNDLDAGTWPNWVNTGIALKANSKPGVFINRIHYQRAGGALCWADWNGGMTNEVQWYNVFAESSAIAPIDWEQVVVHWQEPVGNTVVGKIAYFVIHTSPGIFHDDYIWPGRIYGANQHVRQFDAEQTSDGTTYIFFTDQDEKRSMVLEMAGTDAWSDVRYVVPMDVVDDNSLFKVSGASVINDRLVVTGILKRENGTDMHIYTLGPDHYTMGRDLYLGIANIDDIVISYNSNYYNSPALGGKLHYLNGKAYYVGLNVYYEAAATSVFGVASPTTVSLADVADIRLQCEANASFRGNVDIPYSTSHAALRAGSEVEFYISLGGTEAKLATLGIESIVDNHESVVKGKAILARSLAVKRLSQWEPDANYDYWSQAKQSGNPATLEENIRASGQWDTFVDGSLVLEELNEDGILYAVARASRGAIVRGRFYKPSGTSYQPRYGVILNYYRATKVEAAELTGKDVNEITEADYGYNGIACIWGETEYSGAAGVGVYFIRDSVWTKKTSFALSIPDNTLHWLQAEFHDGLVKVLYRLDSSTTWTVVVDDYTFTDDDYTPWRSDETGRGALFIHNGTPYSDGYGFYSDGMIIGVDDNSFCSSGETVLVDSEQILIAGVSANTTNAPKDLVVAKGYTLKGAPSDNPYGGSYTGHEMYIETAGASALPGDYNDLALVVTDGQGKGMTFKVTGYDYSAPYQWVPSQSYTLPDTWMDHVGDPSHGSWVNQNMRRIFVDTDPYGIVGEGSKVSIVPALRVSTRGTGGTQQTTHGDGKVSIYRDLSVRCDKFEFFSVEEDLSLESMATELARKAGVLDVNAEKLVSGTVNLSHAGWDTSGDMAATGQSRDSLVARFKITSGAEVGMAFHAGSSGTYGDAVTITPTAIKRYGLSLTDPSLWESVPLEFTPAGWITISVQENICSVWINKRLAAVFSMENSGGTGSYAGFVSNGNATLQVDWPTLDNRVDNYIFDMQRSGTQLLEGLIGEKLVYYQDDADGALRLFRAYTVVNAGDPYSLTVMKGDELSDTDRVTRLRAEGGEIAEIVDLAALKEHGSLFRTINLQEANTYAETYNEATRLLAEILARMDVVALTGAADPRIEPNDQIEVTVDGQTKDVIVDGVSFALSVSEEEATFDMDIEGHYAQ